MSPQIPEGDFYIISEHGAEFLGFDGLAGWIIEQDS